MLYLEDLARIRQAELRREQAHRMLVSQVQPRTARRKSAFGPAFNWLGTRLCEWGNYLQERVLDSEVVNTSQA
jgi:hypothetical protein